jgi:ABC-type proline/glycine betaine transport system ATPase subunit
MLKASCAIVVVLMTAGVASAQGQVQVDSGQKVFATQKCSICHSIAGQGNKKHFYGDKGGTREDRMSVPIGHGAFLILGNTGAGKSTLVVKRRMRGN